MEISGIHVFPITIVHAYYREHFATQGFPALFMGKTFAVQLSFPGRSIMYSTLESGIYVEQCTAVNKRKAWKFAKKNKRMALNKRRASEF